MLSPSQRKSWEELVEQVRKGAGAEEALELKEPLQNLGAKEFRKRLVVKAVSERPLSFLPPDLGKLLEGVAPAPQEELVVLPPCLCLDTVLHPEFIEPPPTLEASEQLPAERGPETSSRKRRRESSPQVADPQSIPRTPEQIEASPELSGFHSSTELIDDHVIDLTQD